jgi:hypothetical protein
MTLNKSQMPESCLASVSSSLDSLHGAIWNLIPTLIYDDEFELYDESNGFRITEKTKIADPPMLNDVLAFIKIKRDESINIKCSNIVKSFNVKEIGIIRNQVLDYWDLSKPYLKDQNEQVISCLAKLL